MSPGNGGAGDRGVHATLFLVVSGSVNHWPTHCTRPVQQTSPFQVSFEISQHEKQDVQQDCKLEESLP